MIVCKKQVNIQEEQRKIVTFSNSAPTSHFMSNQGQMQLNVKQADYIVPDRRGIMANQPERSLPNKKFISKTSYQMDFTPFTNDINELVSHNHEEFITAFDRIDVDRNGYLTFNQYRDLIEMVLNRSINGMYYCVLNVGSLIYFCSLSKMQKSISY